MTPLLSLSLSLSPSVSLFVATRRAPVLRFNFAGVEDDFVGICWRATECRSFSLCLPPGRTAFCNRKKKEQVVAADCPCNFISCLGIHRPLLDYSRWRDDVKVFDGTGRIHHVARSRTLAALRFTVCRRRLVRSLPSLNAPTLGRNFFQGQFHVGSSSPVSPRRHRFSAFIARKAHRF